MACFAFVNGELLLGGETLASRQDQTREWRESAARRQLEGIVAEQLQVQRNFAAAALILPLCQERPTVRIDYATSDSLEVGCEVTDLPAIHRVMGKLEHRYNDVVDAKKRTVRVNLRLVDHPTVAVSYTKTLPRPKPGQEPRCKIVTTKHTSSSLVCNI